MYKEGVSELDPGSGWVAGWAVGRGTNRASALKCWEEAKASMAAWGVEPRGMIVHHDQDSVYTSYRWLRKSLIEDEAVVSYCELGAKDNPWMESFWAHFKGENVSLFLEAATSEELERVIGKQMGYYNTERRHSLLEYRSPVEYLASVGFIPTTLGEIGLGSGSALGAHPAPANSPVGYLSFPHHAASFVFHRRPGIPLVAVKSNILHGAPSFLPFGLG